MQFAEQTVIVTGASSGIGRAIALRFARAGADVAIIYHHNDEGAEEVAGTIRDLGRGALVSKTDVSDAAAVAGMVDRVHDEFGRIDCLVNNAAGGPVGGLFDLSPEEWDRVLDIDLKGPFLCTQAVARKLRDGGKAGRVINIGSVQGTRGLPRGANYAAAKAGLRNLTRVMALELAPHGVNVNLVVPGAIQTHPGEERAHDEEYLSRIKEEVPLGRMGTAEEVAELVLFLAGEAAAYITGAEFVIDGGLLLRPYTV